MQTQKINTLPLPIKRVPIIEVNKKKKIIICELPNSELGYIPFADYSIYYSSANKLPGIREYIDVICQSYNNTRKMYRLNSKIIQEDYWSSLKCGDIVTARVTKVANNSMVYCDIGYGIKATITLDELVKIPSAIYSIADILDRNVTFKAKVINRNRKGYFYLSTKDIEDYENINIAKNSIIIGTVAKPVSDNEIFKNNKYHYYFFLTFQNIGYISSDSPIGYGKRVLAKLVDPNTLTFTRSEI